MNNHWYGEDKSPKYRNYTLPIYLALAFVAGMFLAIYILSSNPTLSLSKKNERNKFDEILNYIDKYYVDTVDRTIVFEHAIQAMLQDLDPHSTYLSATENQLQLEVMEGAFEGIGIQFSIMKDTITVVATISGGPSERVGLRAGDKIVTVDGKNVAGVKIKNEEVLKLLRGKKSTRVNVAIKRDNFHDLYHFTIIRDVIPTYTVDVAYMIDAKTGYIKINQFGSTTEVEFRKALVELKRDGMEKLILDLRGNPGGLLETGINVCDELLPQSEMIVYTEGSKVGKEKIYARGGGLFEEGKLVILIDEFSASASEIVAGAIQDNDRGTIVGRRSFGKGLIQRQFNLSDNSSVRLTVARYHTPSGRSIQKSYKNGNESYQEEVWNRYLQGEMDTIDSAKFDTKLKYYTKGGRVVYGGGGIMPDVFIPIYRDSAMFAFNQLFNTGTLSQFAFDYASKNMEELKKNYPTDKIFIQKMRIKEELVQALLQKYQLEHTTPLSPLTPQAKEEIILWLKGLIGRVLYQDKGFYPIINRSDREILKALEL